MALDNNYNGLTKLKDWWGKVKANFTYLDNRISTIITTPAEGVSAQEIIDARKGETALGDKIDAIDSNINEIKSNQASHKAEDATTSQKGHVQLGNTSDKASPGNHNHDGVYEPANAYIMKRNVAQTMTGNLVAKTGTDYTTKRVRNCVYKTGADFTTSELANGDIGFIYE